MPARTATSKTTARAPASATGRILRAGAKLFAQRGFAAVSIHDIATASGVSKANIFHHFRSKEALYLAVLRSTCSEAEVRLQVFEDHDAPLSRRLRHFGREHLAEMFDHADIVRLMMRELLANSSKSGPMLADHVFAERFGRLVAALRHEQKTGRVRADLDPALAAALLLGSNYFLFLARDVLHHFPGVHFTRNTDRYTDGVADLLMRGLLTSDHKPAVKKARTPTRTRKTGVRT